MTKAAKPEELKLPLKFDEQEDFLVTGDDKIVCDFDAFLGYTDFDVDQRAAVGNYIAESVNARAELESRIENLETALRRIRDYRLDTGEIISDKTNAGNFNDLQIIAREALGHK